MKELLNDFGKALVRTPLFSWSVLFDIEGGTKNLEEQVLLQLNDPVFLEALYWGSPQLYTQVIKFKKGGIKEGKKNNLLHTLNKYFIRACTRPTPYGIFAGTGIMRIDTDENTGQRSLERKVRVDRTLMQNIQSRLESDPAIYPHLLYKLNDSLYMIPGQYRFTETIIEKGKSRYQLSSFDQTPFLDKIKSLFGHNQLSAKEIYKRSGTEASFEVFSVFLRELVDSQFLVSEFLLGPTVDDELDFYYRVLNRLKADGIHEAQKYLAIILLLKRILNDFQNLPIGVMPLNGIDELKKQLDKCKIETCQDHFFYADLKKTTGDNIILNNEQVKKIKKGISVLGKLSANSGPHEAELERFKKSFTEKYGSAEVPLLEVLDPEFGIGFPPPQKMGDTAFNSVIEGIKSYKRKDDENWLSNQTEMFLVHPEVEEIRLDDSQLEGLDDRVYKLPPVFSVMGTLLPSGKILVEGVGRAHANALLGRFACLDERIHRLCKACAATEQQSNPEIVFAEIVFQPGGRVGNIACRPSFFEYEIPVLSSAGVPEDRQVPVQDILISIYENQIILRSEKLKKRIIPRLSNAHNYTLSTIPAYKFLSFLQYQEQSGYNITWGNFALNSRFLPRISYGDLILHRACWFLYKQDIEAIVNAANPVETLKSFFIKWKVPGLICLAEGDNELFIDTANPEYLELLIKEIQNDKKVKLVEWLFGVPGQQAHDDKPGIQQFILPLAQKKMVPLIPAPLTQNHKPVNLKFEPGSEWVYFKIYCGSSYSDRVLTDVVKPAIDALLKNAVIQKAFFIRYTDPHYHIRFRLHLVEDKNNIHVAKVLECVYAHIHSLLDNGVVWNLQLDTYQREAERYGREAILISEEVFYYDSQLYLSCLEHEVFAGNDETRFLAAIKNVDKWLSLFGLDLKGKANHCRLMCERFSREFGPEVKFRLDQKYREMSGLVVPFLASEAFEVEFRERDHKLQSLDLLKENLISYTHMSINRWFLTEQRLMEYMCYEFCSKYYHQLINYSPGFKLTKSNL